MGVRAAVIGDVGGHAVPLRGLLESLGATFDPTHRADAEDYWASVEIDWPTDLHVVQVGDLVHRGPDSPGVVTLADRLIERGVWSQVIGNHEQLYAMRPTFRWAEQLPAATTETIARWWAQQKMRASVAITTDTGQEYLVSHAGVTLPFWRDHLDGACGAVQWAQALNSLSPEVLVEPGIMLEGKVPVWHAGPVWAHSGLEVYPSWILGQADPGINQVHGHTSAYDWRLQRWAIAEGTREHLKADPWLRHVRAACGDSVAIGIDPGHGKFASKAWAPLVIDNATVH